MTDLDGLKIFDGANGFFVSMPNKKAQDGEYKDIAFPITKEAREQITSTVLQEYERKLNEAPKTNNSDDLPFQEVNMKSQFEEYVKEDCEQYRDIFRAYKNKNPEDIEKC